MRKRAAAVTIGSWFLWYEWTTAHFWWTQTLGAYNVFPSSKSGHVFEFASGQSMSSDLFGMRKNAFVFPTTSSVRGVAIKFAFERLSDTQVRSKIHQSLVLDDGVCTAKSTDEEIEDLYAALLSDWVYQPLPLSPPTCLLYTSDAADE